MLAILLATATAVAGGDDQLLRLDVAAGKVGEVCMPLRRGDTLAWDFRSSAPADFNLHHHVGKKVWMPVDLKAVAAHAGRHRADRSNDWCLMWTAPSAQAITVEGRWVVEPRRRR